MNKVLAAVDFSPVTDSVLAAASSVGRSLGARVLLLHIVPAPPPLAAYQMSEDEEAQLVAATEKDAARRLERLASAMAGVATEALTATGVPADEIVREALASGAEMIIVGSHGHTALYDLLVGSTAHGVLQRAPCPVLIVPAPRPKPAVGAAKAALAGGWRA